MFMLIDISSCRSNKAVSFHDKSLCVPFVEHKLYTSMDHTSSPSVFFFGGGFISVDKSQFQYGA